MNRSRQSLLSAACLLLFTGCRTESPTTAQRPPIIDMHFHTMWGLVGMKEPLTGFIAPNTPEELRKRTIAELDRHHIVKAVASGDQLESYRKDLGDRVIPGILMVGRPAISPESLREMHQRGDFAVLAEFAPQYGGWGPDQAALEPYWALAEELDFPVGIHMGLGPPGAAYSGFPDYRMKLSNPLQLEEVLVKHPKLRLYVMHAGWPFIDEMIGVLYAHPQVYVDVAVINWVLPEQEFHTYLRRLVDAGFSSRIMFGSDNMMWPESFGAAVGRITSAPFLSAAQKKEILCGNAATFLRLEGTTCE